jgi:hypothetical protein
MTKLITILIIVAALWGGWQLFLYWDKVKTEDEVAAKKKAQSEIVSGDQLSGMPSSLEASYQAAKTHGPAAIKNWLKLNGRVVQDPRKAWIELDYCVAVSRDDPSEAKRTFASVRDRTPQSSPVWSRIKQLEKTYQ